MFHMLLQFVGKILSKVSFYPIKVETLWKHQQFSRELMNMETFYKELPNSITNSSPNCSKFSCTFAHEIVKIFWSLFNKIFSLTDSLSCLTCQIQNYDIFYHSTLLCREIILSRHVLQINHVHLPVTKSKICSIISTNNLHL